MADIEMPQLGETVTEGTITKWFKQVGDAIAEDEVLFEVSTDKVDSEVPSPASGYVAEILVAEGETVDVGTRLAVVSDAPPAAGAAPAPAAEAPVAEPAAPPAPAVAPAPAPEPANGAVLSPVVRRLINENGLDADAIPATGAGGRVTRSDVQRVIESAPAPAPATSPAPAAPAAVLPRVGERSSVEPLNNIRRRTAEHMVKSKSLSPHAYTLMEIDFEGVDRVRRVHREQFAAEEGFALTYLPFVARAVIDAIGEFPHMNATVDGSQLIVHHDINLGIAVDLNFEGLIVPVIHQAQDHRLRALARWISDLANRARTKQLSADDITGGTFTITNAGGYGTSATLAIINQPQVAVLSTEGVARKPVVVTGADGSEGVSVHSVGNVAMGWDHRAFDGAYAAAFLRRVREIIETRDWEAEL